MYLLGGVNLSGLFKNFKIEDITQTNFLCHMFIFVHVLQKYIMAKLENLRPEMNEMVQELKKETAYAVKKYGWNEKHARYMFNRSVSVLSRSRL